VTAASAGGEAKIDINGFGPNPWSVQFFQDKLNFEPNARYNLSFKARASAARSFGVDIEGAGFYRYMDKTGSLTTEMQTFSYDFTITNNEPTKMIFFFGNTGSDIAAASLAATPHTVYIDDVVVTKVVDNGGESTAPTPITVEAESGTIKAVGTNPIGLIEGTAVKATDPTIVEFNVDIKQAGTYKVSFIGKCAPAGIYYELRNSSGGAIGGIGGAPGNDWTSNSINANLSAGVQTLSVFISPGAGSTAYLDKITFELQ
ncbi:MAG: carbohydrate binding domain-containing protein, partial [Bacillota bacterium]|nr:carbohydrate binding domain-containing protein [Bacillota bacterium]